MRIKEGHDLIDTEQWESWWVTLKLFMTYGEDDGGRRNFINPNTLQGMARLVLETEQHVGRAMRIILRSMEKVAKAEASPSGAVVIRHDPAPEGFIPAISGLGFTVIWPLVLTFALAIRFIKVTAEVSGWVR
jgi:hypothetical protein